MVASWFAMRDEVRDEWFCGLFFIGPSCVLTINQRVILNRGQGELCQVSHFYKNYYKGFMYNVKRE